MSTPLLWLQVAQFLKARVGEKEREWKESCVVLDREGTHFRPLNC